MKNYKLKFILVILAFYLGLSSGFSQSIPSKYTVELHTGLASKNTLPFWMTANKFGTVPNGNYGSVYASIFSDFKESKSDFKFSYKSSLTGTIASKNDILINELYGIIRFKKVQLEAGSKNDELIWEGLSASNGNINKSTNTRAFPGITLKTIDYIKLPIAKKWLRAKGSYGEYIMNDKRVVSQTHVHHKNIYLKFLLSNKLSMITGLDHYVQWRGKSDQFGELPSGFSDYLKVVGGSSGGENSYQAEQDNALGNHVASNLLQLNYSGEKTNWNLYWSHPFEDRPGLELSNFPDALYGLFIDLKKPKSLITHILGEIYYTKHQGHNNYYPENYFNSEIYFSGWSYFGKTIGSPFFRTNEAVDGVTQGIDQNYSRFTAYHLGLKGILSPVIQYKTYFSYVHYPGWFDTPINQEQFSSYIELDIQPKEMPFNISVGVATDFGNSLPTNFGGFLKLRLSLDDEQLKS